MRSRFESVVTLPTDERVRRRAALLLQRDRRRQAVDRVDLRHAHLVEQPPRVRRRPTRGSAAAPRRRACRTRATTCPSPETPVNTTSASRGMSTSTFLRLCSRAPRTRTKPSAAACAGGVEPSDIGGVYGEGYRASMRRITSLTDRLATPVARVQAPASSRPPQIIPVEHRGRCRTQASAPYAADGRIKDPRQEAHGDNSPERVSSGAHPQAPDRRERDRRSLRHGSEPRTAPLPRMQLVGRSTGSNSGRTTSLPLQSSARPGVITTRDPVTLSSRPQTTPQP